MQRGDNRKPCKVNSPVWRNLWRVQAGNQPVVLQGHLRIERRLVCKQCGVQLLKGWGGLDWGWWLSWSFTWAARSPCVWDSFPADGRIHWRYYGPDQRALPDSPWR